MRRLVLCIALTLFGCAPKTYTDAEVFGANNFGLSIHAEPSGALIYGEDGTAWGVATKFVPNGGPGLWKTFHFPNATAAQQGISTTIMAVWASGAKATKTLRIAITPGSQWGGWTFSRPMDAPRLEVDLKVARETEASEQASAQPKPESLSAAGAVAAFATGWAQARAAAAANRPIICSSMAAGGSVSTICN